VGFASNGPAGLSKFAGPGAWNDPDFLMTGIETEGLDVLSDRDWQTEFSFWSLFAAPLIVASDIRNMKNKQVLVSPQSHLQSLCPEAVSCFASSVLTYPIVQSPVEF
jgi:hypothetical protein